MIAILTLPTWTHIKKLTICTGLKPSHERFELSKPGFFSTFVLPAMLEDQWRLKKVSNSLFTTKIYYHPLVPFQRILNLNLYSNWHFEFEFSIQILNLHISQSWTMTSPQVSELSPTKEPFPSPSLPLQESKLSSTYCCHYFLLTRMIRKQALRAVKQ